MRTFLIIVAIIFLMATAVNAVIWEGGSAGPMQINMSVREFIHPDNQISDYSQIKLHLEWHQRRDGNSVRAETIVVYNFMNPTTDIKMYGNSQNVHVRQMWDKAVWKFSRPEPHSIIVDCNHSDRRQILENIVREISQEYRWKGGNVYIAKIEITY